METREDSAAFVDDQGSLTNGLLHEQMIAGVYDEDFRQETKRKLIAAGVPQEVMDSLIQ